MLADHSAVAAKGLGLKFNVGAEGVVNANNFIGGNNTLTTLSGTMNLYMPASAVTDKFNDKAFALDKNSTFVIADGGKLLAKATTATISNYAAYFSAGSVFTIQDGGSAEFVGRLAASDATVNVDKGGSLTATYLRGFSGSSINLAGKVRLTGNLKFDTAVAAKTSLLTIKSGADITATNFELQRYTSLLVESGVAQNATVLSESKIKVTNGFADATDMSAPSSSITLNSKNAIVAKDNKNIQITLEVANIHLGLNLGADQDIANISFGAANQIVSLKIDSAVNKIHFDSLSASGNLVTNSGKIIIEGFANDLIHVTTYTEGEENLIFASEENTWKDFGFVADTSGIGGYWLNATQIPEPSTVAAIIGALTLGLAIYRRKR